MRRQAAIERANAGPSHDSDEESGRPGLRLQPAAFTVWLVVAAGGVVDMDTGVAAGTVEGLSPPQ